MVACTCKSSLMGSALWRESRFAGGLLRGGGGGGGPDLRRMGTYALGECSGVKLSCCSCCCWC